MFLNPEAKLLVTLPVPNDRVVAYRFDPGDALAKSGLDYLLVASTPPASAKKGSALRYPLAVKSKAGGVTHHLDSGPGGMTVSAGGVVAWKVPADAAGEASVIVRVRDAAGREVFHPFALRVTD